MMGAPGPRFPAKFSGFPALYAPFRVERRTRGPVQRDVQEIRGVSLLSPGILHANAGRPIWRALASGQPWVLMPLNRVLT